MGEIRIKSGNLALWDKQWIINISGVVEYDKNVWASIIDVRDVNTIYLSGDVTKLNNSIYRIGRFTEYPESGISGVRSTSLGGVLDVTNYNFCLVSCSLYSMPTTRQDLVDEFMITLGSTPPTEFQPYFLNRPAHQVTNGQWVDIPTHHYTNGRWQGELTSQSPLKFWADGEMLDWRIDGASGGVGDWDETAQRYKIPVRVESENLFDGEWKQGTTQYPTTYNRTSSKNIIGISPEATYTIDLQGSSIIQFALVYHDEEGNTVYDSGWKKISATPLSPNKYGATSADILLRRNDNDAISPDSEEVQNLKVQLVEGTYTASTIPPYEVNLFVDHQLMDGDSIDYATDQTQIPIATGNNTLTVDTAVQPSKVFIKFEG